MSEQVLILKRKSDLIFGEQEIKPNKKYSNINKIT